VWLNAVSLICQKAITRLLFCAINFDIIITIKIGEHLSLVPQSELKIEVSRGKALEKQ
jgi:hypothetical protein